MAERQGGSEKKPPVAKKPSATAKKAASAAKKAAAPEKKALPAKKAAAPGPAKKAAKKAAPSANKAPEAAKKAAAKTPAPPKAAAPAAKRTTQRKAAPPARTAPRKVAGAARQPDVPGPAAATTGADAPEARPAPPGPPAPPPRADQFPLDPRTVARPWLTAYPPLVPETYPYPPVALTRLLDDAAKDFPDSVATDFSGRTLTYRRLLEQVDRFAAALVTLGVTKGDRVGIALPNCPQHVIALFAVLRLGAIAVEHNPDGDAEALAHEISETGPRVLVVLDAVYAKVAQLKGRVASVEHVVATTIAEALPPLSGAVYALRNRRNPEAMFRIPPGEGVLGFADLIRRHPPTATQAPLDPHVDVAVLAFEQEAPRRAVMLSHANLVANVFQVRLWVPDVQAGRETVLGVVPLWHPFGLTTALSFAILSAATLVLVPRFDPGQLVARMVKTKPTLFPAAAGMVEALAATKELGKADISSLRACLCDMGTIDAAVAKRFEDATGGRVRAGLGLLEAAPMTHANPIYGRAKADRVGLPLTDTICVLLDPQDPTRLAGPGQPGELAVFGPQVMLGYWNRANDTQDVLRDGWLRTGRLVEVDEDGYYSILGRVGTRLS